MRQKDSDLTRRKFLAASASGLVTAGLTTLTPGAIYAQTAAEASQKTAKKDVIYRQLGKSGSRVPIVSMGAGNCNDPGMIQASYELGMRHYDTAANYQFGANEQMVGSVLKKMGVRDKVQIASKIYTPGQRRNVSPTQVKAKLTNLLEGSLRRLKTDYVDVLYFHDINNGDLVRDPAVAEAMVSLKEQKKALAIGVSTHANMAEVITAAAETDYWDVILTSFNFTMADDTALLDAMNKASKKGIGIVAMKTMAGGGRWPNPDTRSNYSAVVIASAALKWVLRNENVTTSIPGFNNHEHMKADFAVASDLEYTPEEKSFLSDNSIKLGMGFCRQCEVCVPSCPRGVDVPTLMRTHMYAAQYSNFYLARATLSDIPRERGLQNCTLCDVCTAQCARSVDIGRRIDELKAMYA